MPSSSSVAARPPQRSRSAPVRVGHCLDMVAGDQGQIGDVEDGAGCLVWAYGAYALRGVDVLRWKWQVPLAVVVPAPAVQSPAVTERGHGK